MSGSESAVRTLKTLHKCFIPNCRNSVTKTKDKLLVHVSRAVKRKWCEKVNIVYNPEKKLYCCEDHLDLNEDLDNYYQWKFMNARPRLKPTATLKYSLENVSSHVGVLTGNESDIVQIETTNRSSELERMLMQPIENMPSHKKEIKRSSTITSTSSGPMQITVGTQCEVIRMVNKSTMVNKHGLNPKPVIESLIESSPTTLTLTGSATPSLFGSTIETNDSHDDLEENRKEKGIRLHMIRLLYEHPKMYLGLPKQYLWLIEEIATLMSGKELDILITLLKIKLNEPMKRLAHEFELSTPSVTKSFYSGVLVLANYFQNFVFMPSPEKIKENLPLVFKIRYSNVQCILDAFEIEIEKPTDPQAQAQTWSQYKHCNTIKYLVGCTPNGFISYISKGYGGRISDKALVEKSDLISMLPTNAVVMADRGFKEVEALLMTKNIKLLRPPSVYSSKKPSKEEVLKTKVIASLRIHIERVIRRIREYRLLKPHSVVSHKHVGYIDKILLITCGLINLQNEIIKRQ